MSDRILTWDASTCLTSSSAQRGWTKSIDENPNSSFLPSRTSETLYAQAALVQCSVDLTGYKHATCLVHSIFTFEKMKRRFSHLTRSVLVRIKRIVGLVANDRSSFFCAHWKEKIFLESFTIIVILSDLWITREQPSNIRRVKIANSQKRFIYTCDHTSRHLSIFTAASSNRGDRSTSCRSYEDCWFNWVFCTFASASILLPGKRHHQWTFGRP